MAEMTELWGMVQGPTVTMPGPLATLCLAFGAVFGACWGSFANVVIARLPVGQSVVRPRSRCPTCGNGIAAYDNVPILAWLWLRGRCRSCATPISWRYPLIELMGAASGVVAVSRAGLSPGALEVFAFLLLLIIIAFIYLDTFSVEISTVVALALVGLTGVLRAAIDGATDVVMDRLLGGVGAALFLLAVIVVATWVFRKRVRIGPDDTAMGYGDVWILAAIGLCVGLRLLPLVVFLASLQGSVVGLVLRMQGRLRYHAPVTPGDDWVPPNDSVPFGPFLALGAIEAAFFGDALVQLALRLLPFGSE
jgi:leader peptidase (prepilin peptidase) / N-methyltransferase